jgi:hypothetical protein
MFKVFNTSFLLRQAAQSLEFCSPHLCPSRTCLLCGLRFTPVVHTCLCTGCDREL